MPTMVARRVKRTAGLRRAMAFAVALAGSFVAGPVESQRRPPVTQAKPTVPPQRVATLEQEATAQQPLRMPSVERKLLRDARARLRFTSNIRVLYRDTADARFDGLVAVQKPAAGTPVQRQEPVALLVYKFVASVTKATVPHVVGDEVRTALARLKAERLRVAWQDGPAGHDGSAIVSGQTPAAGTVVDTFSTVTLALRPPLIGVPQPPPTVPVPDLLGRFRRDALVALRQVGLSGRVTTTPVDLARDGRVVHQTPAPDARAQRGDTVEVVVGFVPPISVPEVIGVDRMLAERTMRDSGLTPVTVESTSVSAAVQRVVRQDPAGGTLVRPGSAVTLTVPQLAAALPPLPPRPFVPTQPLPQPVTTDTVPPAAPQTPPVRIDTVTLAPQNPPQRVDTTVGTAVDGGQRQGVDTPAATATPPPSQPPTVGVQQADSSVTSSPPEPTRRAADFWWLIPGALAAIAAVAYTRRDPKPPGPRAVTPPKHVANDVDAVADTPTVRLRVPDELIAPDLDSAHDPILAYHVALVDGYVERELDYAPDLILDVEETSR